MYICENCKGHYEPKRTDQKYCSDSCRARAWQLRTGYYSRNPRTQTVTQTVTRSYQPITAAEAYRIAGEINPITGLPNGHNQIELMNTVLACIADMETRMRLMEIERQHDKIIEEKNNQIKRLEREGERARGMGAVLSKLADQAVPAFLGIIGLGAKERPVTGSEVRPPVIRAEQVVFLPTEEPQEPEHKPTKL